MNYEALKILLSSKRVSALVGADTICTPFELIDEILDKLPKETWSNPAIKVLDPACGRGAFLVAAKNRFVNAGLDEEHVVQNMLYGVDLDPRDVEVARVAIDPENKYDVNKNVVCDDSLTRNWGNMKFDVVVMNPPYNTGNSRHKIHVTFIQKALEISTDSGHLAIICPLRGWFVGAGSKMKTHILQQKLLSSIELVTEKRANKLFNSTVGDLGVFVLNKSSTPTTNIIQDGKALGYVNAGDDVLFFDGIELKLLEKFKQLPSLSSDVVVTMGPNRSEAMALVQDSGPVKYLPIIGAAKDPIKTYNASIDLINPTSALYKRVDARPNPNLQKFRVGINLAGEARKLSVMKIIPPDVVVSRNVTTIPCDTQQECEHLIGYLTTSLVSFIIQKTHTGKNNTKQTFKFVPKVDLSRSWTDQELYDHFKLTPEEIKLIEDTVK